jgi:hypothetical protein
MLLVLLGCSKDPPPEVTPDEYVFDCDSAALPDGGLFASDENWAAFVNAIAAGKLVTDGCRGPILEAPATSTLLNPSAPPTFSFMPTGAGCSLAPTRPTTLACRRAPSRPSLLARIGDLVEGTAEAHCGALTGENYVFQLVRAGEDRPVYTAVLSVTSFSPDPALWRQALAGRNGQMLSVVIQRAVFFRGDISEGPFVQPTPETFRVAP